MSLSTENSISIRCYVGGRNNPQAIALTGIRKKLQIRFSNLEMKNLDDIKVLVGRG